MVFNTITVGAAVAPTVAKSTISHFVDRKPRQQKPTAHISYDSGLNLIRKFLEYGSSHTVEEIQAFTSQGVPVQPMARVEGATIDKIYIKRAELCITSQLGPSGITDIGGNSWWKWRTPGDLKAEWIEMKRDYKQREAGVLKDNRVMLYVHGGAYYFGSVDEHRYQMLRHARKLKARVLARQVGASSIILAGDSAGGGMVISMLVILRNLHIQMPAGVVLISPWVDLTHSFPSVSGDGACDYIPAHGFIHKPSLAWPPGNEEDKDRIALEATQEQAKREGIGRTTTKREVSEAVDNAVRRSSVGRNTQSSIPRETRNSSTVTTKVADGVPLSTRSGPDREISLIVNGERHDIKDQIQMYTTNKLLLHPLVSPVLQPSLGGLPPLLILTGGAELLRDEQIYLAHKAANPAKYPPPESHLNDNPQARQEISTWAPTNVQLQVWDDLCHVAPTLSFTRPAKYMYRSIAQFGAWALARAQNIDTPLPQSDSISIISSDSDRASKEPSPHAQSDHTTERKRPTSHNRVGKAGDALPRFQAHMIRQRVDRHGNIYALDPSTTAAALHMSPNAIGVIQPALLAKWYHAKQTSDRRYAKEIERIRRHRVKDAIQAYRDPEYAEDPPPSALVVRRVLRLPLPVEERKGRSWGMGWWTEWGSRHDKETVEREDLCGEFLAKVRRRGSGV